MSVKKGLRSCEISAKTEEGGDGGACGTNRDLADAAEMFGGHVSAGRKSIGWAGVGAEVCARSCREIITLLC